MHREEHDYAHLCREACSPFCKGDCLFETSQFVDQASLEGFLAAPDPALRQFSDLMHRQIASVCDLQVPKTLVNLLRRLQSRLQAPLVVKVYWMSVHKEIRSVLILKCCIEVEKMLHLSHLLHHGQKFPIVHRVNYARLEDESF